MTISCERARSLLTAWIDGELPASDVRAIDEHLAACRSCAHRAACERAAREVVRTRRPALCSEEAPPALRARIARHAAGARAPVGRRRWRRVPASLAATLLLVCSGYTLHVLTGRSTTVLAAQLAMDHVKCHLIERDHGAADPSAVEHRLAERYGFHAKVPASAPEWNVRLIGARRCLTGEGTNAHILYRVDNRPVSLYLVPNEARGATTLKAFGRDAVVWTRDNGTYVLVADRGVRDLDGVARYMQRSTE